MTTTTNGVIVSNIMMSNHCKRLQHEFSTLLVLTGSGIETECHPTIVHALVVFILLAGGKCITTNVTDTVVIYLQLSSPLSSSTIQFGLYLFVATTVLAVILL